MAHVAPGDDAGAPNHPQAKWMGLIAGLSHNLVIGCLMGSFSVMLASVEQRLGVTRDMSAVAGSLVIFGSALIASLVGPLMARHSLRALMVLGALLSAAGYLLLAFTESYPVYIAAYALLFGPSMAIAGSVGPATLVTRWFTRNRGLALGLVHLSIVVAVVPVLSNWVLSRYGAQATYLMLAGMIAVGLLPFTLMIRDRPPGASGEGAEGAQAGPEGGLTVPQLVRRPAFWALATSAAAVITGIMVLTFNMVPIAQSLGLDRGHGALLASIMAFSGMGGSILFGWVADRIGGSRGLALLAFNMAVLFALLLLDLPFAALVVVIGLLGLHGAGMIPNLSRALADALGAETFSRAFGLSTAVSVPFTVIGLWAMGAAFAATGSYVLALDAVIALLLVAAPLAFLAGGRKRALSPA